MYSSDKMFNSKTKDRQQRTGSNDSILAGRS